MKEQYFQVYLMRLRQIQIFVIASVALYEEKYHREFFFTIVKDQNEILTNGRTVIFPKEIRDNVGSIKDLLKAEVQGLLGPTIHSSISSNSKLLNEIGDFINTSKFIELEFHELTPYKENLNQLFSMVTENTKNLELKEKVILYQNIELKWE